MSEKDELRIQAEALGLRPRANASAETLRRAIEEARNDLAEQEADEVVTDDPAPVDDGWPQQIAPLAWLDQDGRRYTDLGEAQAGAQECRDRR